MSASLTMALCALATACMIPAAASQRLVDQAVDWRAKLKRLGGHPGVIIALVVVLVGVSFRRVITAVIPVGMAMGMIGITAVYLLNRQRLRRRNAWQRKEMSSALGITIGQLQVGAQLQQALRTASEQVSEPQLRQALVTTALHQLPGDQAQIPAVQLVAAGRRIAETTGMSLVGILRHARDRLDHEQRHEERTTAALGGAKTTAVILAILPIFGVLMGFALGVNTLAILLATPLGNVLLVAGVAAECMGLVWNNRILEKAAQ